MNKLGALPILALLASCATVPHIAAVQRGGAVQLGQSVAVGKLIATPLYVIEDSRCPENARCITAGRLIISTQIKGGSWVETVPLTLGEAHALQGTAITLVSGLPEKQAGAETAAKDYRFAFEGGA